MKRLAFIIGGVSLFAWGVSGALAGCGGDDGAAPIDSDGGGASTSSGGSSGAASSSGTASSSGNTGGDGGGLGDGGGGGDGGGDGGGGVVSNPGKISCGAAECTAATQICCRGFGGDAGCIGTSDNCQGSEIECDEKADCQGAEICCRGGQGRQRCGSAANCDGFGEAIVCKTNTECSDGGTCKEWSCGGGNIKIRSCTQPFQGCQ